ncbi:MAG: translation elongation factor Ts [Fimbriimonadaceae bacterium]|nr:translation elongation factor Ts [Fimbriimonadaceae bacterium]
MANYTAADVKKLREETDAPMMECKSALDEADGDYARAKEILREKGKAAAGKKVGRATGAGVVAFAANADRTKVAGVIVESETDFVANNEGFQAKAQEVADFVLANGAPQGNPMDDAKFKELADEIIALFRENIVIARAFLAESSAPISTYVHHNRLKGALVVSEGENAGTEAVRKVAVHIVSLPPEVIAKDELPQDKLEAEIAIETKRAMEQEGKPENIARNIATGRVNKEYVKRVVLLEQPFYAEPSKSVGQYLSEEAKGTTITRFEYLSVGANSVEAEA